MNLIKKDYIDILDYYKINYNTKFTNKFITKIML